MRPLATDSTPRPRTSPVATAPSTSTRAPKRASTRELSTPTFSRSALRCSTRSCSNRSVPNALMTCIADSASVASEAISPSWARCLRAICRIRFW